MGLRSMYRSGKPVKMLYYCGWILRKLRPKRLLQRRMYRLLRNWESRPDAEYIRSRITHYCPAEPGTLPLSPQAVPLRKLRRGENDASSYFIDIERLLDYFPPYLRVLMQPGDVQKNPAEPCVIKARRLDDGHGEYATVLNLDRVRHFPHPHDPIPFAEKQPVLIFRGKITLKHSRVDFFRKWFDSPLTDLGDTDRHSKYPEWQAPKISIDSHFRYKYVLVLEGYDVGTALQWVMGSNCVPVMTRPAVEHWLMHSQLKAGVHYIEIADDFHDLEEQLNYYNAHPEEAERISIASKQYYAQFLDKRRELDISLLTIARWFEATGQTI